MITVQLTKLEVALDQIRKNYPKLKPADAALLASALTLAGRHAKAIYDGNHYTWPDEYDELTRAMVGQLEMVNESIEAPKKSKTAAEEEPIVINVGMAPNLAAGEKALADRNDLKTLLSDVLQSGVEYVYTGTDIGWQWALDRVNWSTISTGELSRRIKIKATFTEGAVGIEMGTAGPKKRATKASKPVEVLEPEPEVEPDLEGLEVGAE